MQVRMTFGVVWLFLACGGGGSEASGGSGSGVGSGTGAVTEATSTATASDGDDSDSSSAGDDRSSEELFATLCSPCHGTQGEGSDLGYELRHHDAAHFIWVVRNGRPGTEFDNSTMVAFGEGALSDEDVEGIRSYLAAFEQPTSGEALYADYCGNCHGPEGAGGVVGKDITDKGFDDASEKVREGIGLSDVGVQDRYMPRFDEDQLSDEELRSVVQFSGG